jgi:HlyD family secretion protein
MKKSAKRKTWTLWAPLSIGFGATIFLGLVLGVWGATTNISGAVIGVGKVQVTALPYALQHPIGGVVSEVLVHNGDHVDVGSVVLRLDDTKQRSELTIVEGDLFESLANESRLEALVENSETLIISPLLQEIATKRPQVQALIDRQARRLAAHHSSMETQIHLLKEQILQVNEQVIGTEAELAAKQKRQIFTLQELEQSQQLAEKNLIKLSVVYALQKDLVANEGEEGKLRARIAELRGKVTELELKLNDLVPARTEKAVEELSKLRPLRMKAQEQRSALLDGLSKLDLRSPIRGTIHDSKIDGPQAVVLAAQPLMYVVPNDLPISISVRIDASDIDQLYLEQPASLKFRAFNRRSTPVIFGEVTLISADAFLDTTTKKAYYNVEISLTDDELAKLEGKELLPGMPVDAFISTRSRSPLSYVTKPLMDYFDRAFRDA